MSEPTIPAYWACDPAGGKPFDGINTRAVCDRCGKQPSEHYRIIPRGSAFANLMEVLGTKAGNEPGNER